jgi:NAD+ kinase
MTSKQSFKRIILYARQHRANQGINETLQRVADFIQSQHLDVFLDIDTARHFNLSLDVLERLTMGKKGDLVIVVGGDGSLLSAARIATPLDLPVTGINRGRLGFLTDISPQDIEHQLAGILAGQYQEERRCLLKVSIQDEEHVAFEGDALNDVVLSRGTQTHLIEFDVYIDQQFVSHYRADGLIVATPTGSTAYALSAGGPIMHPALNAMVMVPMFSHSLSSRPLVVDGGALINTLISAHNEGDLQISCDGHESHVVKPGQWVAIEKNACQLRLLHPADYHYYDTLRIKLGWGFKPLG